MSASSNLTLKVRILQTLLSKIRPAFLGQLLKRCFRVKRITWDTRVGRFLIDPISNFGIRLICRGEYEPEMMETLSKLLRPGFVFIDLGANEGFFSVLGARLTGPTGQVIAVEPQARLLPILEENCAINDVAKSVQITNLAVSDRNGASTFFLSPDLNTGSSGLAKLTKYPLPTQEVSLITLSELLDRLHLSTVDLIKIDIEGHEYEAILGSPTVFQEHRVKTIVLELHPDAICKRGLVPGRIGAFLEECGYEKDENFPVLVYKSHEKR